MEHRDPEERLEPGATISGFTLGDTVDFNAVKYASTDTVAYNNGGVTIKDKSGATVASFRVSGAYSAANFARGTTARAISG